MSVRVLVVDDHAMLRSGLRALLEQDPGIRVVGDAANGKEALAQLDRQEVDVMVLDISMPGMGGEQVATLARERHPDVAIVILTMYEDQRYVSEFLRIGVSGFVLKKSSSTELCAGIHAAIAGERYIDPSLAGRMLVDIIVPQEQPGSDERLTQRERDVCRLLALGHTNGEIADILKISPRTVETHRHNLLQKLALHSRAELVQYALVHGLLD